MQTPPDSLQRFLAFCLSAALLLSACQQASSAAAPLLPGPEAAAAQSAGQLEEASEAGQSADPTPFDERPYPERPQYQPGELVDYSVQTGDTLPALAVRFNTTIAEIRQANPIIPSDATTLPPGMPMQIPIYYLPFWGSPYQIIPDALFINGPAQVGFDTAAFIAQQPGWLNGYAGLVSGYPASAAQMIDIVALNFSISPRLLLALLEYQTGALTNPELPQAIDGYLLGLEERGRSGLYRQLNGVANILNNNYYDYRIGTLATMELSNGRLERFDPWQNAASAALQHYFSRLLPVGEYVQAIGPNGLAASYRNLFGDPWDPALTPSPHIPGSLTQPEFRLPFEPGSTWAFTGGPHTGWGAGEPLSAIDFAPPSVVGGCMDTDEWSTAVADGVVARSETAIVVLDLDGDGDERTGWAVFYLHLATEGRAQEGQVVKAGDPLGHPSCEGGRSTGTHVHIARKYNGEWAIAYGPLAFNLEGWIVQRGPTEYEGFMTRFSETVTACVCSDYRSHIRSER